jgi:diguanylate cyclase (GGDEF)-like protein
LSLISLDVDHFKALNDSEGHQRGDECLVLLGSELTRIAKRRIDLAARVGGEEFALILPMTCSADALQVAESLRAGVEMLKLPHPNSPVMPFLTISLGVATATNDILTTPEKLTAAADQALYRAKRGGRNMVVVAEYGTVEQDLEGSSMANPS